MIDLIVVQEIEIEKEILLEVKPILEVFDVMLEEIPHGLSSMRNIQHQIDLIPSSILPNKPAYRMSSKEHEELKMQVDDSLDKGLIQKSKIPFVVLGLLVPNKDGSWRMCIGFQAINDLLIHKEVRFNIRKRME